MDPRRISLASQNRGDDRSRNSCNSKIKGISDNKEPKIQPPDYYPPALHLKND